MKAHDKIAKFRIKGLQMPHKAAAKSRAKRTSRHVARGGSKRKNLSVKTEEECLYLEIEELNKNGPEWYEPNLIAGAKQLLQEGNKIEVVAAIYGEKVTREAQKDFESEKTSRVRAIAASASSQAKVFG